MAFREAHISSRHPERPARAGPATWEDTQGAVSTGKGRWGDVASNVSEATKSPARRWKSGGRATPGVFFEEGEDTMPQTSIHTTSSETAAGAPAVDPNHHLWRNGRLWWVAFTVHLPSWQKERVRLSLGTADVIEARRRRDQVLAEYPLATGCTLSLRLEPPRERGRRQPITCAA
jgi:hypothetical protein